MKARLWIILVVVSAALQIFSLPPYNFWWLGFLFAVPLFVFYLKEGRLWRLIFGTLIYRFLFALGAVYFIFDPVVFGIPIIVFLGFPVAFFVARRFLGERAAIFSLPLFWAVFDYLASASGFFPSFAINSGAILGQGPFLGLARWGGFLGMGFFVILVNWLIFLGYYRRHSRPLIPILLAVGFLLLGWQISSATLASRLKAYEVLPRSFRIAAISTNPLGTEFDGLRNIEITPEKQAEFLARIEAFLAPLKEKLSARQVDLVALPEALVDVNVTNDVDKEALQKFNITNNGGLIQSYRALARSAGTRVVANLTTIEQGKKYNSNLFFSPSGELEAVYHKRSLAIGGEYWPFGTWRPFYFGWFLKGSQANAARYGDNVVFHPEYSFSFGKGGTVLFDNLKIASPICLEIHDPTRLRRAVRGGANIIINTSSNLWVPLGIENYLALTNNLRRIEAVWLRVPIIVSGRRDIAGIFTPDGSIESIGFANQFNVLIGEVKF
ncbi:MAG: hypothetical protein HYW89_01910 [Candidatus Sungiibacteriota bacterium]|uniref:CN hydrolase domain-containing protein n=1 Tax=Candidatus Sungiibacteriota bacterium TaxID=2750080 RepID=A0A7T5RK62_9BACT|nr:MAG: hypothetical protein HYW89_01910 [Candidatus Sungbacteria bacterium]